MKNIPDGLARGIALQDYGRLLHSTHIPGSYIEKTMAAEGMIEEGTRIVDNYLKKNPASTLETRVNGYYTEILDPEVFEEMEFISFGEEDAEIDF